MRELIASLDRLRGTDLPVLISGETGTGKELVARILHEESRRRAGPFRIIDSASIPDGLFESELFGARAGAFTDIIKDRPGILPLASGGTVLFDEIAGTAIELQAKILRVISAGTFRPLGGEEESRLDVRFIFSTARDLDEEVRQGRFRGDLLHRIRVLSLRVPSLRERPEDLEELINGFLREGGGRSIPIDPEPLERLRGHPWPGNVRELKNLISRLLIERPRRIGIKEIERVISRSGVQTHFPGHLLQESALPALKDRLERDFIIHHFHRLEGNTAGLCRYLAISQRQLYRRCKRLSISLRDEKKRLGEESRAADRES